MEDCNYPSVSVDFIISKILQNPKIDPASQIKAGNTTTFLFKGTKAIFKRKLLIREIDGEIPFIQATSMAIACGFMTELLAWFEANKNWKEGGYLEMDKDFNEAAE